MVLLRRRASVVSVVLALLTGGLVALAVPAHATAPNPPGQPATGPAGTDYCYGTGWTRQYVADATKHSYDYWIYVPKASDFTSGGSCGSSAPSSLPVTVLVHGDGTCNGSGYTCVSDDDAIYSNFINHLVRKGSIVIYPRYQICPSGFSSCQVDLKTGDSDAADTAKTVVATAISYINGNSTYTIKPSTAGTMLIGHSLGATIVTDLAARVGTGITNFPRAKAVLAIEGGQIPVLADVDHGASPLFRDLSGIPDDTYFTCMTGTSDVWDTTASTDYFGAGEQGCEKIMAQVTTNNSGLTHKEFLRMQSDGHAYLQGGWGLWANHLAPETCFDGDTSVPPDRTVLEGTSLMPPQWTNAGITVCNDSAPWYQRYVDTLDVFGPWKLGVALKECTFNAASCLVAQGGDPSETTMGQWSDGVPVNPILRYTDPPAIGCSGHGDPWASNFYACPNWRSPAFDAPGSGGNGFETASYAAHIDGNGYPSGLGLPSSASNANGANDTHLFWGYDFDQDFSPIYLYGGQIIPDGIEVQLKWTCSAVNSTAKYAVDLSWDGGTSWTTAKNTTETCNGGTVNTSNLGSTSETWGHTWVNDYNQGVAQNGDVHWGGPFRVRVKSLCTSSCSTLTMNLDYVPSRLTWHYNLSAINNFSFEQYPLDDGNGSTNDWFMASGNGYPIANPSSIYGTSGVLAWELKSANSTQLSDVSQVIQGWTTNTSGPVTLFMQGKGKVTGTGGTPNGSIGLFDGNNNLLCYLNYTTSTLTYKSTNCTVPQNTASLYISGLIQATSGATNWILDIDNVGLRLV